MYVQRLKSKYKEILHPSNLDSDSQSNSTQHVSSHTVKHNPRVLTEYNENVSKSHSTSASSAYVLALKERIAQATQNLQQKNQELSQCKQELVRKDEQIRILEQQLVQSKNAIEIVQRRVVEAKVVSASLEKDILKYKEQVQALSMDRELALKQSQYYKSEVSKANKEKTHHNKTIHTFEKYLKQIEATKGQNSRLKEDIKRLQDIINEMCQQRLNTDVTNKHFLGKPLKEASMWFPQNLVGEVEHFLKKEQIAQGNKKFTNNLVKFISKYSNSVVKSKASSGQNSRVRSTGQSSHCRSASMCDPGYTSIYDLGNSLIKKNQSSLTSALKKSLLINKYKKMDSKKYTTQSLLGPEQDMNISTCQQILNEYRRVLKEALKEKQVKPKTIIQLSEQMRSAVLQLYQEHCN